MSEHEKLTSDVTRADAGSAGAGEASREAAKGPWFWNFEGCWILKRELFDDAGNHDGYEMLDGDYDQLARDHAASVRP